ncbi:hypothetical protein [Novosphingobium resinovorum]|uniref:hypothetical protein n=1 Tax=Novosphingobium resinovorum TaxID=158500 RepID=UPI002ED3E4E3|nr:hypothetical protein [Novosphingobium resinovorum]
MAHTLRAILMLGAAAGLGATLSGCGPDDGAQTQSKQAIADVEWPLSAYGIDAPADTDALPPLPDAEPMAPAAPVARAASSNVSYANAPRYYDESYYRDEDGPDRYDQSADDGGGDPYALIALAGVLGGVLGSAPPDYGFGYEGAQPWAWETGDHYRRYAEPIDGGYRYYYYAPRQERPFLVRDPYYSYGYRGDRIAYIYDRDGRVIDRRRAERQRLVGDRYRTRGYDLYRASQRERRFGVSAPLWAQRRGEVAREQARWDRVRQERRGWRDWDRRHDDVVAARWTQERAARRFASDRFDTWRKTDYRGEAPRFYREAARDRQLRKAALAQRETLRRQQALRAEQRRMHERRQEQRIAVAARHDPPRFMGVDGRPFTRPDDARREQQRREQAHRAQIAREQQRRDGAARQQREVQAHRDDVRRQAAARSEQARSQQVRRAQQQKARQAQLVRAQATRKQQQQAQRQRTAQEARRAQQVRAEQARARQASTQQARQRQQQAERARVRQASTEQARQRREAASARQQQARAVQQRRASQARQAQQKQAQVQQARQRQQQQAQRAQARQAQAKQSQARQAQARQAQARQAQAHQAQQRQAQARQRAQRRDAGADARRRVAAREHR